MEAQRYLQLSFAGSPVLAYPEDGVPKALWKVRYPHRGGKFFRRLIEKVSYVGLDKLIYSHVEMPLAGMGFKATEVRDALNATYPKMHPAAAYAWPSPARSPGRAYAYVFDRQTGVLLGFGKFAYSRCDVDDLYAELEAAEWLKSRSALAFHVPSVKGSFKCDSSHAFAFFELVPLASRKIQWQRDSWQSWVQKMKTSFAAGTVRMLSGEEVLNSEWGRRFLQKVGSADGLMFKDVVGKGIEVCATHGDFAQHNFLEVSGDRWIFDWEMFTLDGPLLVDELTVYVNQRRFAERYEFEMLLEEMKKEYSLNDVKTVVRVAAAAAFVVAYELSFANDFREIFKLYASALYKGGK